VLVVEDEEDVRHLVGSILRNHGYEVLEASGAREALHIHERHAGPIHVLLTDVIMPGKSGREVARELRRLRPGIRTIFMSGYTDDTLFQQSLEASQALFLGKPFTPSALLRKLAESAELAGAPP
jgi:CheY-like chemotaxis protein